MGARFSFTGKLEVETNPEKKMYYLREGKTKSKNCYKSITAQVAAEKNNRAFVELFGSEQDTIKTMDKDGNKIEVQWEDRFDEDVLKQVASYKKTVVKVGDERNEYISSFDAIDCIISNLDELKGSNVIVTGQRVKNLYKDKLSDRFQITSIRPADEDSINRLSVTMDFFFDKSAFDTSEWNKEHKLYINGYTEEYIGDLKENRYVPQQIVFDCTKIDFENEKHRKLVEFRLKVLGCELTEDNKVVVKLKSKNMMKLGVVCTYVNGSEQMEFNESMLTDLQREAVELGISKLEDFKPSSGIYGERVVIYKLRDFSMKKDSAYEDGAVDSEISIKEFEEKIWTTPETESVEDIDKDVEESESESELDDDEDLFG